MYEVHRLPPPPPKVIASKVSLEKLYECSTELV